jgi:hypothetical protein
MKGKQVIYFVTFLGSIDPILSKKTEKKAFQYTVMNIHHAEGKTQHTSTETRDNSTKLRRRLSISLAPEGKRELSSMKNRGLLLSMGRLPISSNQRC